MIINTHELININVNGMIWQCKKCKILLWHAGIHNDHSYWLLDGKYYHTGIKLNLTCDEVIVKNIIE